MGRRQKKGRHVNGILLLDKPQGLTSNAALQQVKQLFAAAKVGHTGSLDPLATGLLPLCFGEATKFSQFLLDADKEYRATFRLGIVTDTGDADGKVLSRNEVPRIKRSRLTSVLSEFAGEIEQIPSMFSALKHKGEPLYKLARRGEVVERKPRVVSIFKLELTEMQDGCFTVEIRCSKGTYIRSLAEDIGARLGCGAHVCELRRLASGPYDIADAYTIDELAQRKEEGNFEQLDGCLLPLSSAVKDWPAVNLPEATAYYLRQGQPVQISHAPTQGWVRIFRQSVDADGDFMGVGEILGDGRVAPRRLIASS